jgi:hypothetical protein
MPKVSSSSPELTPTERRQQVAEILARGVLRRLRQRKSETGEKSAESGEDCLDVPDESRLNARGG